MNNSFIRKHKMLSAFFVFGVLAIIGGLTIYQSQALSPGWTQTTWNGQSDEVIIVNNNELEILGTNYKEATPHIDFSQEGQIGVSNIISNPGFESDILGWTSDSIITHETTTIYSGVGSIKMETGEMPNNNLYQSINTGTNDGYYLSVIVKNETIGDLGLIDETVINLLFDGNIIDTAHDINLGNGWHKIYSDIPIPDNGLGPKTYGIVASNNKTLYIDDFQLFQDEPHILTSSIFDMGEPKVWDQLSYSLSGGETGTTDIIVRTGNTDDLSDAPGFGVCVNTDSGTDLSDGNCVYDGDRYIQYQVKFLPNTNPPEYQTLDSITIHAYPSTVQFGADSFEMAEGDTPVEHMGELTISLNSILEEDATVTYTISGTAEYGADAEYEITTPGYDPLTSSGQITIAAGQPSVILEYLRHGDTLYEDDETIIITLSDPVHTSLGTNSVYTYTILDDDPAPTVSWTTDSQSDIENNGLPVTITATLDTLSGKDVTIPFNISGTALGAGVDYTLTPEPPSPLIIPAGVLTASFTVEFNNDNIYETEETIVSIISTDDLINATTNEFSITEETVTIINDEPVPLINFTDISSNGNEDITTDTIEISLSTESALASQVDYIINGGTATNGEDYILVDSWVTIPAGETSTNITLDVIDDFEAEENETIIITLSNPVPVTDLSLGINTEHTYTINDDDVPGISATLDTIDGYTTEWDDGNPQRFEITLNTQPDNDVVIDVASNDLSEGTVDVPSLTFTTDNWDAPQYITITGVDDDIDDGDILYSIILTISPLTADTTGYAVLPPTPIGTTNMNEDVAGVIVTPTELTTYEYGSSESFNVVLTSEPEGIVVIDVLNTNPLEGTLSTDRIQFDNLDWETPQTITVDSANDILEDGAQQYQILITINTVDTTDPQYASILPDDIDYVYVTNMDDDSPGITVLPIPGNTTEAGGTAEFTVVLNSQPNENIRVPFVSSNTNEGTVQEETFFGHDDWNIPQNITVTGVDDSIDDGHQSYEIQVNAYATNPIADPGYEFSFMIEPVGKINEDDDTAGINVSAISSNTNEAGGTALFTIELESEPTADVSFDISSSDLTEGNVSPATVTFTSANWNDPQVVTITGVDDNIVDGTQDYQIDIGPATSLDILYDGNFPETVPLQNIDNDTDGFTIIQSAGSTNVTEGSTTDSYTMRLNTIPDNDVVVTITPNAQITVNPTTLTFTAGNWNINQTVTVTAVNDTTVEGNHTGTISHSVASADIDYNEFVISNILVAITDNDSAPSTGGGGGFWYPSHNPDETPSTPSPTPTDPQREQRLEKLRSMGVPIHGLIKIPDDGNPNTTFDSIVYYVGTDGRRHVFPNASIYKTWYDSFRDVRVYSIDILSQIQLGENIRYKPGVKMIKFNSNNRVYAIESGGKLRWILNEKVAWYMYGKGWQKYIVSLPDSLFPGYEFADDISHSDQFDFAAEAAQSQTISMELGL